MSDITNQELVEKAFEAQQRSYSPYSEFKVGAALLSTSGKVYLGTNIENASYGLAVCAERNAVFKAVYDGEKTFSKIAVVGGNGEKFCMPCGACRQVIVEFAPKLEWIFGTKSGELKVHPMSEILPNAFEF
jgi:cytidine deaminase